MMKKRQFYLCLLVLCIACSDEDREPTLLVPTAKNVEIGYDNQKKAMIGEDFHFNADVRAGERIEEILIQIQQRDEEQYAEFWEFELVWEQYKGLKNTNIHEHFTLPTNAPLGIYDFVFIVKDTNGEALELREGFEIIDSE